MKKAAFWVLLAAVTVMSLVPASVPLPSTGWDKANHALAFAVLGVLGMRCWPARRLPLLLALLAYGGCIEVAQSFTETRMGEWLDLAADAVGLGVAWAVQRFNRA